MGKSILLVLLGSLSAAAGQVFLKLGAQGAVRFADFLNGRLAVGFALYAFSAVVWVLALSKLPLSKVYPFTVLTFVLVYLASFVILGERITAQVVLGAFLVMGGLMVIATA